MDRRACFLAMVMVAAVAVTAMAGEGHKCTASTQECLDYMKTHMTDRGWVGIEYDQEEMKVIRVIEGSPAERAGFHKGDVMVGMEGIDFAEENMAQLQKIQQAKMKPGNTMTYTVRRAGQMKNLEVTLGELPDEVLAQWVGNHMLKDHAEEMKIASKN
jgi:C-terminal processing protease CtpA/Prc